MDREEMKYQAEKHYANAVLCQRWGDEMRARFYASMAIDLYKKINVQTLQDAAPTRTRIYGIELPDIMHEDVVRERLGL